MPERTETRPSPSISPEALIGLGTTIAAFGVMFLLLGCAQYLRDVKDAAGIWFGIGAPLFIIGLVTILFARSRRRRL